MQASGHEVIFEPASDAQLCLYICPPGNIKLSHPGLAKAAFTMHERRELPETKAHWPEILNGLDLVLTPTEWNRDVWRELGVTVPIEVVPLGINPLQYHPPTGRRCTILSVHEGLGSDSSRENWRDTLHAYYREFGADDRVLWQIKTWRWHPQRFEQARADTERGAGHAPGTAPAIEVIDQRLDHTEMRALYQQAALFIKDANREGWGLPANEALACGTPVAATEIEPLVSFLPPSTSWFAPGDVSELRAIMRSTHEAFGERQKLFERYTWQRTAAKAARALEAIAADRPR